MKIYLITSNPIISDAMKDELAKIGDLVVINAQKMTANEVISKAGDAEILIAGSSGIEKISREMLQGMKKLKMIATLTVGVAWLDIEATKEFGVTICNVKGANAESVAEHAWGMILSLAKRITEFDRDTRNKGAFKFADYVGKEVYGKTLGIIGLGDIGTKIARIAKGFDMRIMGFNKSGKSVDGIEVVDLETLLKESDIIVTSVPLTNETTNMISDKEIALMKDGVILVNPAMEPITNKEAVVKAVDSGKIFGFGIETEIMKPVPQDSPYLTNSRILVTPHNAFNTEDANIKTYDLAISNVKAFISGKPQNVVI
ncbi:MAG: Glycerate dehydrogenase [Candidatus Woesebacteria bacterium GW2011_GWB1_39_10]|uniref:Glycerate dehydrogenase n=2 Tax=Candidatus Woeseibacteriota TaxID=1752722 RepID=A0A0G0PSB8_9BACT|nr:MAG: Glycerate dehydrogenase [Candidatus Woesebacteria bacterium GW2011_GWB1_39_10]KKS91201.1 MAG: Glycerate dehydrogenase [Candidatus Woesebacteria bacterium GW2011_GWA1_43_12]